MNPWAVNPTWQNFSSLFREATTASEARTGMERSHHLTAALYFGIASLEAFLNERMRTHLRSSNTEEEIIEVLRRPTISKKLEKWPNDLLEKNLDLRANSLELIKSFNDVRGHLTHPKTSGHDIYRRLETIDPAAVVEVVAEYVVRFHEAEGTRYPYWLFGWNYLNPRPGSYEIFIINDQQFLFSLQALGSQVPGASYAQAESWKDRYFRTFSGYEAIRDALNRAVTCEPKFDRFPYRPVLCKRWWTSEHQSSCGHVTKAALNAANEHGRQV